MTDSFAEPVKFNHDHYVPVLKTKAGERWALQHVEFKMLPKITPVLEIHAPTKKKDKPAKPIENHIPEICKAIEETWGHTSPFFLDTEWVNKLKGTAWAITAALESCRENRLKVIPVVRIDYDDSALAVVKSAMEKDKRGCMLRLDFDDLEGRSAIRRALNALGTSPGEMHLLLDYREHPMQLDEHVEKLPSLNEWLTFSAASAAFPRTIKTLKPRTWNELPRYDWSHWKESVVKSKLPRRPSFGDYGTRCSGPPAGGGDPDIHLRYTQEMNWLVYADGTMHTTGADNIIPICRNLISRPEYEGREFSQGDWAICYMAGKTEGPGIPQHWLQWCLNHHFAYVVRQIQKLSAI